MRGGHRRRRRHHHRRGENACASTSGGVSVESHRGEECVGAEMLGRGEDVHRRRERRRGRENSPGRRLVVAASKLRATHTVRAEAMTDRGKCLCACKCVFVCLQFSADSSLFFSCLLSPPQHSDPALALLFLITSSTHKHAEEFRYLGGPNTHTQRLGQSLRCMSTQCTLCLVE